jgi:hypothetical protein
MRPAGAADTVRYSSLQSLQPPTSSQRDFARSTSQRSPTRSRNSATTVIAGQHRSIDRPRCSRRIGRLLGHCPPKPASDRPEKSQRSLLAKPALNAFDLSQLAPSTVSTPAAARRVNLPRSEFAQTVLFRAADLNRADNGQAVVTSVSGCLGCYDIPQR